MFTLKTLEEAEKFVSEQRKRGNDVRWDNYDILFYRPSPRGYLSPAGAFRNGRWGFENKSVLTDSGTWRVDPRNVR